MTTFYLTQENNVVSARIKSGESINAWQGTISFSGAIPKNVITEGSVSLFWQTPPNISGNEVSWSGGVPGGFSGDGILFKIILEEGSGKAVFSKDTSAYLNDGTGRAASSTLESLNLFSGAAQIYKDINPPLAFRPQVLKIKSIFQGQPVAVFITTDKESGISHYEIKEYTTQGELGWHTAQSPYLINQGVKELQIKAVDNFGNVRLETLWIYPPPALWVFLGALMAGLILYNVRKRWQK
jgi:hypothetical protein